MKIHINITPWKILVPLLAGLLFAYCARMPIGEEIMKGSCLIWDDPKGGGFDTRVWCP